MIKSFCFPPQLSLLKLRDMEKLFSIATRLQERHVNEIGRCLSGKGFFWFQQKFEKNFRGVELTLILISKHGLAWNVSRLALFYGISDFSTRAIRKDFFRTVSILVCVIGRKTFDFGLYGFSSSSVEFKRWLNGIFQQRQKRHQSHL